MGSEDLKQIKKGVVKRQSRRLIGLFIDGTGLDRASRRLKRRVDMASLIRGVCSGTPPIVARYYTVIPHEDDSRQLAFLDALSKAKLDVITRRLPPKGVTRQITVDAEMAADIIAFAMGHNKFGTLHKYLPTQMLEAMEKFKPKTEEPAAEADSGTENNRQVERVVIVVCPSRDLAYSISLAGELGADTVNCDFGEFAGNDVLKSAAKWVDLSDSETIWRPS